VPIDFPARRQYIPFMEMPKVAIVTGASRGIGAAIARELAARGIAVVVNYASRAAEAEKVVNEIESQGGKALPVQADVSVADDVERLFDEAEEAFGAVDVLVNSAGTIQPGMVPIGATDDALFERLVNVNFKGTFHTMRLAAKRLRSGGSVVNLSTSVVAMKLPGYGIYAATKAAVEAMTAIFAREMRGRGITVNAVAPGPTATELFLGGKTPEQVEALAKMAPLERIAQPVDIARVVVFLATEEGSWVNGQTIRANGGIV